MVRIAEGVRSIIDAAEVPHRSTDDGINGKYSPSRAIVSHMNRIRKHTVRKRLMSFIESSRIISAHRTYQLNGQRLNVPESSANYCIPRYEVDYRIDKQYSSRGIIPYHAVRPPVPHCQRHEHVRGPDSSGKQRERLHGNTCLLAREGNKRDAQQEQPTEVRSHSTTGEMNETM